jgi:hypothetical protein
MAVGAVEGLCSASAALTVFSDILKDSGAGAAGQSEGTDERHEGTDGRHEGTDGRHEGTDGRHEGTDCQKKTKEAETAFAEATLAGCLSQFPAWTQRIPPKQPARTLGKAIYMGFESGAGGDTFPSAGELRARLARAEGPGGPGPGSREALVLRSVLGCEIADTGGWATSDESLALLKEASAGLDALAGADDPDSLAAKERLARRLYRMSGPARVLPYQFDKPTVGEMKLSLALFRELEELARKGAGGEPLLRRARLCAFGVECSLGKEPGFGRPERPLADLIASKSWLDPSTMYSRPDVEAARGAFDMGEIMYRHREKKDGLGYLNQSMNVRRYLLGARHPETASSLARAGDVMASDVGDVQACLFWALALEALKGQGKRHERHRADLELRIGRTILFWTDAAQAAPLLERALGRYRSSLGEMSQECLEAATLLGLARFWSMDVRGADETFRELSGLLDGAPARKSPDPNMPADDEVLATARAALEVTSAVLGCHSGDGELLGLCRPRELATRMSPSVLEKIGDMFRSIVLAMQDSYGPAGENRDGAG